MSIPEVAVIVPVRNALPTLPGLIAALAPTRARSDVELVFVDDASTDATVEWLRAEGIEPVCRAQRGGPAAARNDGVRSTVAPVVVFCDADTEPPADLVERVVSALSAPDVVAVVGVYDIEPLNAGFWPRYKAVQAASYHRATEATEITWIWASMSAVRRDVFDAVGGFDERYCGADLEDVELGHRLATKGRILLDRDYVVGHHFASTAGLNIHNHFHRGRLWVQLFLARRTFDNYLTDRRHAVSRLLLVGASVALVGVLVGLFRGGGGQWTAVVLALLVINTMLTRDLYRLAWARGGTGFTGAVAAAETLMSWVLVVAAGRAAWDAVRGASTVDRRKWSQ